MSSSSSSPIGSMQNVKVFVLYLMQNVGYPLDYITINEVVMQTDFVAALDFAQAFTDMEDAGLVAVSGKSPIGEDLYTVTERGVCVVDTMRKEILPSILEDSLTCALRFLDFRRRGVKVVCSTTSHAGGGYDFHCAVREQEKTLMEVTVWADSAERAERMENQFRSRPESMYRGILALLSGNVNYLLD